MENFVKMTWSGSDMYCNYPLSSMKKKKGLNYEQHGAVDKNSRNNRFMNSPSLPRLSEISGAIHLALSDLVEGRRNAGEI